MKDLDIDKRKTANAIAITPDIFQATKLVLDEIQRKGHCLITDIILHQKKGKWCISDLEQQALYSSFLLKDAAMQFVLMEGTGTIMYSLGEISVDIDMNFD